MRDKGNNISILRSEIRFYLVDTKTRAGKMIDIFTILLNLLVCAMYVIETYPLSTQMDTMLWRMEVVAMCFFILEYAARTYAAENRWKYVFSLYSLIDLAAILPVLSLLVLPVFGWRLDFTFVNTIRVFKVFRIFRFIRFTADADFFFGSIPLSALKLMRLILTIFILFFVSSGLFFHVEHLVNPKVNTFGDSFYYTVITLTTVGFGDITPVSEKGRWVTTLMVLSGIILIPWQAGQAAREWIRLSDKKDVICPNCGLKYHDADASHCKACGHVIFQVYEGD